MMRRPALRPSLATHRLAGAGLAACLALIGAPAASQQQSRLDIGGGPGEERFVAGEEVRLRDANVADLIVAGGEVVLDRVTAEDMIVAGGSLRLRRTVVQDLIAAGGDMLLAVEVRDDLIAAGGRIRQPPDSSVGGYAMLTGGDIELEGSFAGNLHAVGGRVRLAGEVKGDVHVAAGRLIVAPGARIGGKLTYRSGAEADIAPDAVIAGGVRRTIYDRPEISVAAGIALAVGAWLATVLGLTLLAAVLHIAVPGVVAGPAATLSARPWASLGLGVVLVLLTPPVVSLLFFTVIGVPLAMFAVATFAAALAVALTAVAFWLGRSVARRLGRDADSRVGRILWTLAGLALIFVVVLIPFVGFVCFALAVMAGLGAAAFAAARLVSGGRAGDAVTSGG